MKTALDSWEIITVRCAILFMVMIIPVMMNWEDLNEMLRQNLGGTESPGWMKSVERVLKWTTPWELIAMLTGSWLLISLAIVIHQTKSPSIEIQEDHQHLLDSGNPQNFMNHLHEQLRQLRHDDFPNREVRRQDPALGVMKTGETRGFMGEFVMETQPLTVNNGRCLSAALLEVGGAILTIWGAYILIWNTHAVWGILDFNTWFPNLAAGLSGIVLGTFLLRSAVGYYFIYRFHSDLIKIVIKGTCTASELGLGDGRGGLFIAHRTSVQSDTWIDAFACRLVTECACPAGTSGYTDPVHVALRSPRFLVDTVSTPEFQSRLNSFLQSIKDFRDSGGLLVQPDLSAGSTHQLVQANARIASAMQSVSSAPSMLMNENQQQTLRLGVMEEEEEEDRIPCPYCAEKIQAAARLCRFCKNQLG